MLHGIRGRVTAAVLAITAVLYSLLGALGFVTVANAARDEAKARVERQLDVLEASIHRGTTTVGARTADGIETTVELPSQSVPAAPGELRVERRVKDRGTELLLVGTVGDPSTTNNLRSLYRLLWIGIPIASVTSALLAGLATKRALRPVEAMSGLAATIGRSPRIDDADRIPVPDTGDEIERLATNLNDMLDRIEHAQRQQRQFTSDAAHELRTPLMALQGELELATPILTTADPELPAQLSELCERLRVRIDDLLLLSTLDETGAAARVPTSLRTLLVDEVDLAGPTIEGDDAEVTAEPALLARALRNLLANARRHATSTPVVRLEPAQDRVWIHVDDDGPGIPAEDRRRIFERFARLDEARTLDRGGAGLGLAIARSVAEAHGGGIEASTSPEGGARLSIYLPLIQG